MTNILSPTTIMPAGKRRHSGFADFDCLIPMAVIAITLAIAVPIYTKAISVAAKVAAKSGRTLGVLDHLNVIGLMLVGVIIVYGIFWLLGRAMEFAEGQIEKIRNSRSK